MGNGVFKRKLLMSAGAAFGQTTPPSGSFIRIPGGTFTMGSPPSEPGRYDDETQHTVTVSTFSMSKYEVTRAEYEAVMGNNPSYFKGGNLPVECVSWFDAIRYCNALSIKEGRTPAYTINGNDVTWNRRANGYRLPTEAEWEYACRAGTTTPFSYNITTGQANYNLDKVKTTPVGSFASNGYGLFDMHGNVWEWCWDWYGDYSTAVQTDPTGPTSGSYRVIRGGSWHYDGQYLRSASRNGIDPGSGDNNLGFRLACPE